MTPYYIYFGFSFSLYLLHSYYKKNPKIDDLIFFILLVFIILFTGLRYQVGSDWQNYEHEYLFKNQNIFASLANRDFGFSIINYFFKSLGLSYISLNLFVSIVAISSVFLFCKNNPNWFIGVFMSIPYFFTMCIMGYVRQGYAIAILFLAIYAIQYNKKFLFLICILFAISIHKSSIIYLPLFVLLLFNGKEPKDIFNFKNIIFMFSFIVFTILIFILLILLSDQWASITSYLVQDRSSSGALIRSVMNLIPAIIFIIFRNNLNLSKNLKNICYFFTFLSIIFFLIIISQLISSTFIDRFGLSLIIFNTIIFARISFLFKNSIYKFITNFNIILYNFLIMYTLLHHSNNGHFMYYKLPPLHVLF